MILQEMQLSARKDVVQSIEPLDPARRRLLAGLLAAYGASLLPWALAQPALDANEPAFLAVSAILTGRHIREAQARPDQSDRSLGGWLVSTAGSLLLAMVIARLAAVHAAAGGPYAYTRDAFGDLAGFVVAWGYWISVWCARL